MSTPVVIALLAVAYALALGLVLWVVGMRRHIRGQADEANRLWEQAQKEIDTLKKDALLEAKDEAHRLRTEIDRENRERRAELQRTERRLIAKEESLDRRLENLERREKQAAAREQDLERAAAELTELQARERAELERISGISTEEATQMLLKQVEIECRHEAAKLAKQIEDEAREAAEKEARKIVTLAIQRCAVDQAAETTVSVVPLPNDEMKGRIIGREGRNIRAFEAATGVDLIIDDTPEAVVISGFDPVRREIARASLTKLISDGRIHPGRIEEVVAKAKAETEEKIREGGEQAVMETGVTGLHPELVRLLGKLHFRTSYGQNVRDHSIECAHLAAAMAAELGADVIVAKRGALLHDLGKAVDFEVEGPHAAIGVDLAKRHHESPEVIHCIAAHHGEEEFQSIEAVLVQVADAISAARPGARRETLETYIKRLEKLEKIADSSPGVEKSFAIQAGREVRVMVKPEVVDDLMAVKLAKDVAQNIESELQYPGQIKVTVIRETRAVEYAK